MSEYEGKSIMITGDAVSTGPNRRGESHKGGKMNTSDQIDQIAEAFAKAQADISPAKKDKKAGGGAYGYTYASLATVMQAVLPALAKHSLAVVQTLEQSGGQVTVTTRLLHASGQWIEGDCSMPVDKPGAQAVGSAISYGRRYGVSALLGVVTEDDDGAAAGAGVNQNTGAQTTTKPNGRPPASPKRDLAAQLEAMQKSRPKTDKYRKQLEGVIAQAQGSLRHLTDKALGEWIALFESNALPDGEHKMTTGKKAEAPEVREDPPF